MTLAVRDARLADLPARPQLALLEVVALRIRGAGDLELGGSVQLARMVFMEAAADG